MEYDRNRTAPGFRIDRRGFLALTAAGTAGAFLNGPTLFGPGNNAVKAQNLGLSKYTEQLPIPGVIDATSPGSIDLVMAESTHTFHSSLAPARTWGYGGASYLGPTIEAKRAVPIIVNAINSLGEHPLRYAIDTALHGAVESDRNSPRASVHLHGGNSEPDSDGGPEQAVLPGNSRQYFYNNDQEAANLWYHDHALGITRLNVFAGLAGFYLLRDEFDTGRAGNPIGLPAGDFEVPLVIQDKSFNADGSLAYSTDSFRGVWVPEFFGNVAVVNGKVYPNLHVDRGLYRFRVINGSNARVYNLYFSTGQTMFQIGGDGGLLNAPVPLSRLIIAPGERADILIDFSSLAPGTKLILKNSAPVPFPDGPRSRRRGGEPLSDIMQFTVRQATGFSGGLPTVLRQTPIARLSNPIKVRNLSLVEIADEETGEPIMALINNLPYETTEKEDPVVDTVEQWNIINTTGDAHPIHLHLVQFQLMGRQKFMAEDYLAAVYPGAGEDSPGPYPVPSADSFAVGRLRPPVANEMGWKDTVRTNPGEITRLLVPFGANAAPGLPFGNSFTGEYVFHCHILEHEDNEMMLPYRVRAAGVV